MITFLNGKFVSEENAKVSVLDRGFLYGDGLFETIRVSRGHLLEWPAHMKRLQAGADFLRIRIPLPPSELLGASQELILQNSVSEALLRITISRGIGPRGYSPKDAKDSTLTITVHPAQTFARTPPGWKLHVASVRLPANEALAFYKTCNKLPQILAKAEAESAGADEAVLCNTDGFVIEGASSNLFWTAAEQVFTSPLASGVLAGVTRAIVIDEVERMGIKVTEKNNTLETLMSADGIFLSLSSLILAEAVSINGRNVSKSALTKRIYERLLLRLCPEAQSDFANLIATTSGR
jgi:aminodeoxychorismate lyase